MVNIDRHIAISAGWIAGPAFGVAMMAAPEYFHLGPIASGLLFWGGILVFLATIAVVAVVSAHEKDRQKVVLGPIIVMAFGALIFCGGAAWYFWPSRSPDLASQADPQTGTIPLPPEVLAQANRAVENLSHASNDELRARTANLVVRLKGFTEQTSDGFQKIFEQHPDATRKSTTVEGRNDPDVRAMNAAFNAYANEHMAKLNRGIRPEAIALRDAMLKRSPSPPNNHLADTFFHFSNANPTIMRAAADYLEALARSLP